MSRDTAEVWAERASRYWERDAAPSKQVTRYVKCGDCRHYTGRSPCSAGLHTSGDPPGFGAVRICTRHEPEEPSSGRTR